MYRVSAYFFLFTILGFQSCKPARPHHANVFYMNIYSGITSMDPAFANIQSNIWVVNQLYNGLVQLDDSLHIKPCIASRWEISPDGKQYTFHLRNDVYFTDDAAFLNSKGRKAIASDFSYSFSRLIDKNVASPGKWIFNDKVDTTALGRGFYAMNDSTFQISLKSPFPPFLQLLSMQYCSIVPHEAIEKYCKDFRSHPVGTGPFKLRYYDEGERLVLEKNPNYFEKPLPYLDAVDISFTPGRQNEFFSFAKGDLDFLSGIDPSFKDNLLTRNGELRDKFKGKFQFQKSPYLNTEYLGIVVDSSIAKGSPLVNKYIRQAMNYGIDREKMMKFLRNNIGTPGEYGFVPPSLPPFDKGKKVYYNYNPAKAKALIFKAGYPQGQGLPEIKLITTANYQDLAVFVQRELQDIGIKLKIEIVLPPTLSDWKAHGKTNFFRASWIADYTDAENYLSLFYSKNEAPNGPNYFHFKNAEFDKLYLNALNTTNEAARDSFYVKMQDIVMDEAPAIVLYYDEVIRLESNRVSGLNPNPINLVNLKKVRLK